MSDACVCGHAEDEHERRGEQECAADLCACLYFELPPAPTGR